MKPARLQPPSLTENEENMEQIDQVNETDVAKFLEFLAQEPDTVENIKDIFRQYIFLNEFDPSQARNFKNALYIYLGDKNADFLLGLLTSCLESDETNTLTDIQKQAPHLEKMLRYLLSMYGTALEKNLFAQDENSNSWRALIPRVEHEIFSGQFIVKLEIEKYSGEVVIFEETPLSVVQLVNTLISILNEIPSRDISPPILNEEIDNLEEVVKEFIELYRDGEITIDPAIDSKL